MSLGAQGFGGVAVGTACPWPLKRNVFAARSLTCFSSVWMQSVQAGCLSCCLGVGFERRAPGTKAKESAAQLCGEYHKSLVPIPHWRAPWFPGGRGHVTVKHIFSSPYLHFCKYICK